MSCLVMSCHVLSCLVVSSLDAKSRVMCLLFRHPIVSSFCTFKSVDILCSESSIRESDFRPFGVRSTVKDFKRLQK